MTATVLDMPIDPALAKRVRATAQAAEKKRQERDALITQAHLAGASLREIGELVGLSHVGVMKILNRGEQLPEVTEGPVNRDGKRRRMTPEEYRRSKEQQ